MNDNSIFFEAHFIHERFHQVDATSMTGTDVFGGCRPRHLIDVKSSSFVLYCDSDFIRVTAETNMHVFARVLMISVSDRVREGFAQCYLNFTLSVGTALQ